jgi:hypothetical protein
MSRISIFATILYYCFLPSIFGQVSNDLFISEYVEGSGNNKAIEIFNPTTEAITLSNYYLARYSNGSNTYTDGGITQLQGGIDPLGTHVIVNGQTTSTETSTASSPGLRALADQLDHDYPAPTYFNGNDAIALFKDTGGSGDINDFELIDLFGIIGGGMPSSAEGWGSITDEWIYRNIYENDVIVGQDSAYITNYIIPDGYYFLRDVLWSANHSLVRKPNVTKGVTASTMPTAEFDVTMQWDTLPGGPDNWSNLGKHSFLTDTCYYSDITYGIGRSHLLCNDDSSGRIEISVTGSFPPYEFLWSNNDTTRIIDNLSAGSYVVTIQDSMGCIETAEAIIYEPDELIVALETTNLNCYGDSTAQIQIDVSGGTKPYTIILNNDTISYIAENLPSGRYHLQIIDGNGCQVEKDFIIENPDPVIIGNIIGETNPEKYGTYQYSVPDETGASFLWMVEGGNIISGQGTNVAKIQWGLADNTFINVVKENASGCFSDTTRLEIHILNTYSNDRITDHYWIYPNPANNIVTVDYPFMVEIRIFDLAGGLKISETNNRIDVSSLLPGLYIVEAIDATSSRARMLLEVQH